MTALLIATGYGPAVHALFALWAWSPVVWS